MQMDDPAYPFLAFAGIPSISFHFISPNVSTDNRTSWNSMITAYQQILLAFGLNADDAEGQSWCVFSLLSRLILTCTTAPTLTTRIT